MPAYVYVMLTCWWWKEGRINPGAKNKFAPLSYLNNYFNAKYS